jgi:hypothetical protein
MGYTSKENFIVAAAEELIKSTEQNRKTHEIGGQGTIYGKLVGVLLPSSYASTKRPGGRLNFD